MPLALWPLLLGGLALARPGWFVPTTWPKRIWLGFCVLTSVPALLLTTFAYLWFWAGDGVLNLVAVPLLTLLYGFWGRRFTGRWMSRRGHEGVFGRVAGAGASVVWAYGVMGLTLISVACLHFAVFGQPMDIE